MARGSYNESLQSSQEGANFKAPKSPFDNFKKKAALMAAAVAIGVLPGGIAVAQDGSGGIGDVSREQGPTVVAYNVEGDTVAPTPESEGRLPATHEVIITTDRNLRTGPTETSQQVFRIPGNVGVSIVGAPVEPSALNDFSEGWFQVSQIKVPESYPELDDFLTNIQNLMTDVPLYVYVFPVDQISPYQPEARPGQLAPTPNPEEIGGTQDTVGELVGFNGEELRPTTPEAVQEVVTPTETPNSWANAEFRITPGRAGIEFQEGIYNNVDDRLVIGELRGIYRGGGNLDLPNGDQDIWYMEIAVDGSLVKIVLGTKDALPAGVSDANVVHIEDSVSVSMGQDSNAYRMDVETLIQFYRQNPDFPVVISFDQILEDTFLNHEPEEMCASLPENMHESCYDAFEIYPLTNTSEFFQLTQGLSQGEFYSSSLPEGFTLVKSKFYLPENASELLANSEG